RALVGAERKTGQSENRGRHAWQIRRIAPPEQVRGQRAMWTVTTRAIGAAPLALHLAVAALRADRAAQRFGFGYGRCERLEAEDGAAVGDALEHAVVAALERLDPAAERGPAGLGRRARRVGADLDADRARRG